MVMPPMNNHDGPYFSTLESIMRVTVAGFGGALAGLSFARRGRLAAAAASAATSAASRSSISSASASASAINSSSRIVSGASSVGSTTSSTNNSIGKKRLQSQVTPIVRSIPPSTKPYVDRELPVAWALACMTFAGIVEGTRIISPTSVVWELMHGETMIDESSSSGSHDDDDTVMHNDEATIPFLQSINAKLLNSSMVTISDYMLGGAVAGALFKGSAVRSSAGAKMDASIMGISSSTFPTNSTVRGRTLSGIFPGAALGLLAGFAIVAMDHAQILVEENLGHWYESDDDDVYHDVDVEMEIPADIKAMSNEELMQSIENLKNRMSDISREEDNTEVTPKNGYREVRDLISMLGFRPHRS
jgi:hypothetical protein